MDVVLARSDSRRLKFLEIELGSALTHDNDARCDLIRCDLMLCGVQIAAKDLYFLP